MRVRAEQLGRHLAGQLAPIYVISGDEPLLVQEAADAVRAAARERGHSEREVLFAEPGFDWNRLTEQAHSLSLFAERRIIELRLGSGRPGEAGARALTGYAAEPAPDTVLLVVCGRLDAQARGSRWYKALDKAGVTVQLRGIVPRELPRWIAARLKRHGLEAEESALALLAERTEGNLLAAAQDVDKLALLADGCRVDEALVARSVGDSARFDLFSLADAALAGDGKRALRMLAGLRAEGVEPPLVLWALARELRTLAHAGHRLDRGGGAEQALTEAGVWERRRPLFRSALRRHDCAARHRLVARAGRTDLVAKGAVAGNPWDEMVELVADMAGAGPLRVGSE